MAEQPQQPSHQVIDSLPVWGVPVAGAVEQMQRCRERADYAALMADHHLGYAVPVGGVIAYAEHLSPSGVGFDISCGNKAILLDAEAAEVRRNIGPIMDDLWRTLSFGIGRRNPEPVEHELFDDDPAWDLPEAAQHRDMARAQLGTIGSGNHYVDLFADEVDRVWVGVHFGSRGLGHKLASHFVRAGGGRDGIHVDPVLLATDSDLGRRYLACMQLAGRYAYAGRDWVCARVARLLGATILDEVHNHHNFAWRENHFGRDLWVVRKGATPAFPGQRGFIGGSMGDISVIVEGVDSEESRLTLRSTVHGAGRVMSRRRAAGKAPPQARPRGTDQHGRSEPRDDAGVAAARRRGVARRRHRRVTALLQAHRRGARLPRRQHPHPPHPHPVGSSHGRPRRVRPLPRLNTRRWFNRLADQRLGSGRPLRPQKSYTTPFGRLSLLAPSPNSMLFRDCGTDLALVR